MVCWQDSRSLPMKLQRSSSPFSIQTQKCKRLKRSVHSLKIEWKSCRIDSQKPERVNLFQSQQWRSMTSQMVLKRLRLKNLRKHWQQQKRRLLLLRRRRSLLLRQRRPLLPLHWIVESLCIRTLQIKNWLIRGMQAKRAWASLLNRTESALQPK